MRKIGILSIYPQWKEHHTLCQSLDKRFLWDYFKTISGLCFRQSHPSRKRRSFPVRTECWLASLPATSPAAADFHRRAIRYLSLRNTARSTKHLNPNIKWEAAVTGRCCLSTSSFSRVPILQGSLPPGHSREANGHLPPSRTSRETLPAHHQHRQ